MNGHRLADCFDVKSILRFAGLKRRQNRKRELFQERVCFAQHRSNLNSRFDFQHLFGDSCNHLLLQINQQNVGFPVYLPF